MKHLLTALFLLFTATLFAQPNDSTRWTKELKDGKITARDFQTLLLADKDLEATDSVHRSFLYPFFHQFVTKPVIEKEDVIIYALQFLGGAADGMNQALVYHGALKGHPFWDYSTSWKRKYRHYPDDLRAAWPGSKTWSVMFTDGNHFTRGINRGSSVVSVAIAMSEHDKWYEIVKEAIIASLINRLGFTLVYDHILKQ